jgi:hypothetical protein
MLVERKKVDYDEDDPYQIPDNRLPNIPAGEIKENNFNPQAEKHLESQNDRKIEPEPVEQEKVENPKEVAVEPNDQNKDPQVVEKNLEPNYNDPLREEVKNSPENKEIRENYPSIISITKHVDEEKQKLNPDSTSPKPQSKHNAREGSTACKKCLIY